MVSSTIGSFQGFFHGLFSRFSGGGRFSIADNLEHLIGTKHKFAA